MRKEKLYKKIKKNIFSFSGFWSNKDIFYYNKESENDKNNTNTLKYKLINHYGKIFFRLYYCLYLTLIIISQISVYLILKINS